MDQGKLEELALLSKSMKTRRGFTYRYFCSKAGGSRSTLLFLHGFPNFSFDWHHQVSYFKDKGFGIIVPDMLGYGGTDKPEDYREYRLKLISNDIVDILDNEGIEKCIGIAHDWWALRCCLDSQITIPKGFMLLLFFCVGYAPPQRDSDLEFVQRVERLKAIVGDEFMGYMAFFNKDTAAQIIEEHIESFTSAVISFFYNDPKETYDECWKYIGDLDKWLIADRKSEPSDPTLRMEIKLRSELYLKNGMQGPTNYYKCLLRNDVMREDNLEIPQERIVIAQPVLYCSGKEDPSCPSVLYTTVLDKLCPSATIVLMDAGHSVFQTHHAEANERLHSWIEGLHI